MRRRLGVGLGICLCALGASVASEGSSAGRAAVTDEQVRRVHQRAIVVDTHADTLWRVLDEGDDISVKSPKGHIDLPRLKEWGVDAQFFAIWVQPSYCPDHA